MELVVRAAVMYVVLFTLVRPLLTTHPLRRLSYPVFAYGVFGATTPSLYDRTFWLAMCLSIVAVVASRQPVPEPEPTPPEARHLALVPASPDRTGGLR